MVITMAHAQEVEKYRVKFTYSLADEDQLLTFRTTVGITPDQPIIDAITEAEDRLFARHPDVEVNIVTTDHEEL
jgi:hypothetical protein